MKRSPPQDKVVVKKIETTGKDFDDDKKYLVDWNKKQFKCKKILVCFFINFICLLGMLNFVFIK